MTHYRKPHPQVTVRIGEEDVLVDTELVRLVPLFNQFEGFTTISNCQGSPCNKKDSRWDGHIAIRNKRNDYRDLCRLGFGTLFPLMEKADTWHSISENIESPITLWVVFPKECIQAIERETGRIVDALHGTKDIK